MSTKNAGGSSRRKIRSRDNRRWKSAGTSNPVERAFNRAFNSIRARQNG